MRMRKMNRIEEMRECKMMALISAAAGGLVSMIFPPSCIPFIVISFFYYRKAKKIEDMLRENEDL